VAGVNRVKIRVAITNLIALIGNFSCGEPFRHEMRGRVFMVGVL
jgi:hypothetical protein